MINSIKIIFKKHQKKVDFFRKSINQYRLLIISVILFLVCLLSYGKILEMNFFLEDYLILFSIQNPDSPDAGYGSGIVGRPFGYAVTPFIPFYYLFGLNPFGYYLVEIIIYFLASLVVYYFAKILTDDKRIAFGAALIFASGYVGSGSLYRMAVGWQNILAIISISLSGALYFKFIKNQSLRNYVLVFAVYLLTSEFSFYRAHGIILIILFAEFLFNFKLFKSIIRMIPFVFAYWYFYIFSLEGIMDQRSKSGAFIQKILIDQNYRLLLNPIKTLENLFLPDNLHVPLYIFIMVFMAVLLWKKNKYLIYCLSFVFANFLVYFYHTPESIQETTHRYLTISFVGVAIFWSILFSRFFKSNIKFFLFCLIIVLLNINLARQEQSNIIENRSKPTKIFWDSFRSQISELPKGSVVYIDSKLDGVSKPARDAAVGAGSMSPTASFATYYNLDWEDVYLAENFPELLGFVKDGIVKPKNIFTFFYSRDGGLVNTSKQTKANLVEASPTEEIKNLNAINLNFSTPLILNITTETKIEYKNVDKKTEIIRLAEYLEFLSSRNSFYDKVSVIPTTQVKHAEARFIKDQNLETSWRADDIHWESNHREELILNLEQIWQIGGIKITPANIGRNPTKSEYECSLDNHQWKVLIVNNSICKFVKVIILETESSGPPQIAEIEVIESKYAGLDLTIAEEVFKDPFQFVNSLNDKVLLLDYLSKNGVNGKICSYTNKSSKPVCKKYVFNLGKSDKSFLIEQSGTILEKIEFLVPKSIQINIKHASIKAPTFKELIEMGYTVDN